MCIKKCTCNKLICPMDIIRFRIRLISFQISILSFLNKILQDSNNNCEQQLNRINEDMYFLRRHK